MSVEHIIHCDGCDVDIRMETAEAEMPPYWIGAQFVLSNGDGMVPVHERDNFSHFCSIDCLTDFLKKGGLSDRQAMVDRDEFSEGDEDDSPDELESPD